MRLHLDRDRDEPLLWEETVRLEPEAIGPDLLLELGPIEVAGRVDHVAPEFLVGMDLRYGQSLACTRCLRPVHSDVTAHSELRVVTRLPDARSRGARGRGPVAKDGAVEKSAKTAKTPPAQEARRKDAPARSARAKELDAAAELELDKDEMGVLVLDGEHLDTEPLIAEQILLEVPMKPLCEPDCKGLCPRCGADRNATPDCCAEPASDERWEALGSLRDVLPAEGR